MTIEFHRPSPSGDGQGECRQGEGGQTRSESVEVLRCGDGEMERRADVVAREEPLEIRLGWELRGRPAQKSVSVTMRTPGHDEELAAGFLFGEGLIEGGAQIEGFEWCDERQNILRVLVRPEVEVDLGSLERHFYTTSSCGVCGKASLEALEVQDCPTLDSAAFPGVEAELICGLPGRLREAQAVFETTGGLHAAGLFDAGGELLEIREDVGRHNAMDKVVGARLLESSEEGPVSADGAGRIAVLSGRASFELLQKALMARIPMVVAVGAPSSLAVDVAEEFGITLIGFAREGRFNVYSHAHRLANRRS